MKQRTTYDEKRMIQYLLGQMDPAEQARLEERYVADPELRQELEATERDLIDQYVRGELANPGQFEKYFLNSPRRRQKLEFARALMQSLANAPVSLESSHTSFFSLRRRAWLPVAATLVLAVGVWQFIASRQAEQQIQQVPLPPAPPEVNPRPPEPSPAARSATLVLTSNLTRNTGETPTLVIGDNAQVVLQLQIEPADYKSYRAEIRTAEGVETETLNQRTPQLLNSGPVIILELPAGRFNDGDYTIKLTANTADGQVEEVGSYYFRVKGR
jgi:hypothetical protein